MKKMDEVRQARMQSLRRTLAMAAIAKEENLGPLEAVDWDVWQDLKVRAGMGNSFNPADPSHKIAKLIAGKNYRRPKVEPTLLEDRSDQDQEWRVFGELRQLTQTISDTNARGNILPYQEVGDSDTKPEFDESFEFASLYKQFAHNTNKFRIPHGLEERDAVQDMDTTVEIDDSGAAWDELLGKGAKPDLSDATKNELRAKETQSWIGKATDKSYAPQSLRLAPE